MIEASTGLTEFQRVSRVAARALGSVTSGFSLVRLSPTDVGLSVSTRNESWSFEGIIEAEAKGDGEIFVPGRAFLDLMATAAGGTVELTANDRTLHVAVGPTAMDVRIIPADPWPDEIGFSEAFRVTEDELSALARILYACGDDLTRPMLTGVNLNGTTATALDRDRLARTDLTSEFPDVTVPSEFLKAFLRHRIDPTGVTFRVSSRTFRAETGHEKWDSRILPGAFPKTEHLVPRSGTEAIGCARSGLINAVRRMAVFDGDHTVVRLQKFAEGQQLTLDTGNTDYGSIREDILASGSLAEDTYVRADHLREVLEAVVGEEVTLQTSGPTKPLLVTDAVTTHVLMPRVTRA